MHRDFRSAVPTRDHFLPLLYLAGLVEQSDERAEVMVAGYTYGSLIWGGIRSRDTIRFWGGEVRGQHRADNSNA